MRHYLTAALATGLSCAVTLARIPNLTACDASARRLGWSIATAGDGHAPRP